MIAKESGPSKNEPLESLHKKVAKKTSKIGKFLPASGKELIFFAMVRRKCVNFFLGRTETHAVLSKIFEEIAFLRAKRGKK